MTPLNIILASAKMVFKRHKEYRVILETHFEQAGNNRKLTAVKDTSKIIQAIDQSGEGMYFYN